jgi:hypothetical protein
MKRVLNSGQIKLPYVEGSEQETLNKFKRFYKDTPANEVITSSFSLDPYFLNDINFTFEIKAPLLIFNSFQKDQLGKLIMLEAHGDQEAYLPSQFYKQDVLTFIPMDAKTCNEFNTKLNNFYNWSFNFYKKLIESGLCHEQAVMVLPQGMFVSFYWTVCAKDLITFIETHYNKSPELFGYCSTLNLYLDDHLPLVSKWLKRNKWQNLL